MTQQHAHPAFRRGNHTVLDCTVFSEPAALCAHKSLVRKVKRPEPPGFIMPPHHIGGMRSRAAPVWIPARNGHSNVVKCRVRNSVAAQPVQINSESQLQLPAPSKQTRPAPSPTRAPESRVPRAQRRHSQKQQTRPPVLYFPPPHQFKFFNPTRKKEKG